jgi:two-component system NtrC family sensor kinase
LASGIAHEINNPLTGILTFSNLLKEDLEGSEYEEDLDTIIDETMRCRKIVRGVLDFARETRLERERTNINRILKDVLSLLKRHVHFHNVKIKADLSDKVPDQEIDINMMKSVVNNLAMNASDSMPLGGTLSISSSYEPDEKMVRVTFKDTGIGIPEENLKRIFDPFFTTKAPGEGTGLGMSVTYGIIRRHNGRIHLDSSVGKGTTVTIELPLNTNRLKDDMK